MREALPAAEFGPLVGVEVDELERLRALGLLDLERDGLFDDLDLLRLDTVRHFAAEGWVRSSSRHPSSTGA